jgi:hypothetical protein
VRKTKTKKFQKQKKLEMCAKQKNKSFKNKKKKKICKCHFYATVLPYKIQNHYI